MQVNITIVLAYTALSLSSMIHSPIIDGVKPMIYAIIATQYLPSGVFRAIIRSFAGLFIKIPIIVFCLALPVLPLDKADKWMPLTFNNILPSRPGKLVEF